MSIDSQSRVTAIITDQLFCSLRFSLLTGGTSPMKSTGKQSGLMGGVPSLKTKSKVFAFCYTKKSINWLHQNFFQLFHTTYIVGNRNIRKFRPCLGLFRIFTAFTLMTQALFFVIWHFLVSQKQNKIGTIAITVIECYLFLEVIQYTQCAFTKSIVILMSPFMFMYLLSFWVKQFIILRS